jgi:flagellar biosynthesis/type III secretory pathway ATPase
MFPETYNFIRYGAYAATKEYVMRQAIDKYGTVTNTLKGPTPETAIITTRAGLKA